MSDPEVESVDVDREVGITVRFADGLTRTLTNEYLRTSCPCATCRGLRDQGQEAWPRPGGPAVARIENVDLVGNWGIGIQWNDGHSTGIYPWAGWRSADNDAGHD